MASIQDLAVFRRIQGEEDALAITAEVPGGTINVSTSSTLLFGEDTSAEKRYIHNLPDVPELEAVRDVGIRFDSTGAAVGAVAFYLAPDEKWETTWKGPICAFHAGSGTKPVSVGQE